MSLGIIIAIGVAVLLGVVIDVGIAVKSQNKKQRNAEEQLNLGASRRSGT